MAAVSESSSSRFFCHQCNVEIPRVLPDFKCPRCNTGFIEEMVLQPQHSFSDDSSDDGDTEMVSIGDLLTHSLFSNLRDSNPGPADEASGTEASSARPGSSSGAGTRRRRPQGTFIAPIRATRRRTNSDRQLNPLENIIQEFIINLSGFDIDPAMLQAQGSPMFMYGNPGDYAFGRAGLDAIITQILNQMDGTGPPPMAKNKIDEIPIVNVQQAEIDKNMQCSVCWDDFKLGEPVRKLVCEHLYHEQCIVPWLQLHGTCPICRKSLNDESEADNSSNSASAGPSTSARSPSSSSSSSSNSGNSNSSNSATSWLSPPSSGFLSSVIGTITNAFSGVGSTRGPQSSGPSSSSSYQAEGDASNSFASGPSRHSYNLRSRERPHEQDAIDNENSPHPNSSEQRPQTRDQGRYNFEDDYD